VEEAWGLTRCRDNWLGSFRRDALSDEVKRTNAPPSGSQASKATLLFDPSMSALLIIASQWAQSVRLFTCKRGT